MIIILSLGGSLIVPESIDTAFLRQFTTLIKKHAKKGKRFVIVCGGGKTARRYMEAARKLGASPETQDWLGIAATKLNAFLLQKLLASSAGQAILTDPRKAMPEHPVHIAAGWQPGRSTDYDAVAIAKRLKTKQIINLSNIDFVYDRDPNKHRNAKPLRSLSWKQYLSMVGNSWSPGLNTPFDPIAAREAAKLRLRVTILNGKNLRNLEACLQQRPCLGTVIS